MIHDLPLERRTLHGHFSRELDAAEWQAVSLLEFFEGKQRLGLRVLLAPRDAWIGVPRA